jgi:type IV secretion system protein VirB6
MSKIKSILCLLLLLSNLFISQNSYAYGDADSMDDSCTEGTGILNRIVADITTLGLFSAYSAGFYMVGAPDESEDGFAGDANGCDANYYPMGGEGDPVFHNDHYCEEGDESCENDLAACEPEGGVKICYEQTIWNTSDCLSGCLRDDCNWARDGWSKFYWAPPGDVRVIQNGDKICAQFWTTIGYQSIGCKYIPDCDQFSLEEDCFVALSCTDYSAQESKSMLPMTGVIIQCVTETVNRLFIDTEACGDGSYTVTSFPGFQQAMRNAVRSCLMLYIILFGLKTVLGHDAPSKSEFFTMGAKFVLVMYFSTGININMNTYQDEKYADGITTYMKPLFINGSSELANMVYSAAGSEGLCAYDTTDYADGYSYLALWDSIDCRLIYYLGVNLATLAEASVITYALLAMPVLLGLLVPAFLSFQIIFMVFVIIFFVFFLSMVIYFVNLTVISIILVSILIYLAPVFVPMALFEATKGYFDGWLKTTISYALQPMIVAAYIAMMLTIFDQTMFGDCAFEKRYVTLDTGTVEKTGIPFFMLCDPDDSTTSSRCSTSASLCPDTDPNCTDDDNITQCKDSIGYYINPIVDGKEFTESITAIFFTFYILKANVVSDMLTGLVTLCLFGYLFFKFGALLGDFAGELTGGSAIGSAAGDPMAVVKAAGSALMDTMKYAAGRNDSGAETSNDKDKDKPRDDGSGAETSADKKDGDSKSDNKQITAGDDKLALDNK